MDRFQLKHATICHFCRTRNLELERSKFRRDHESSGYGAAVFLSESGTTAFEALKDLLLEIAQERELGTLLPLIVRRVAESSESVALARIWLLGPGDSCATCRNAPVCPSHEQCLHLAASAIRPLHGSVTVDSQLLGAFRRIPIGAFKVGAVVAERRAVIVADATSDPYIKRPEWVREEGIQSFGGQPLLYREHVLGVLGVFLRMRLSQSAIDVLRVLANHAAAAIASARAFEEIARLQTRLQRENEYLREVVTSHDDFTTIVGSSPAIYHVKRQIDLVAPTDATVLVSGEPGRHSSASTARPSRASSTRASSSGTPRAPSPGRSAIASAASKLRRAGRSFSTRSARSRSISRENCSACCKRGLSSGSARRGSARPTCASSPPPTGSSRARWPRAGSARTSITD